MAFKMLCAVLLALATIHLCTASIVYVKPDYHYIHCPGEPCHPLSYYVQQISQYFVSNTTMVFLNGTHCMEALQPVIIKSVENFTMKGSTHGLEDRHESSSRIECIGTHRSGFNFISGLACKSKTLSLLTVDKKHTKMSVQPCLFMKLVMWCCLE